MQGLKYSVLGALGGNSVLEVCDDDLLPLLPDRWGSDDIINMGLHLLWLNLQAAPEGPGRPKIVLLDSFFYQFCLDAASEIDHEVCSASYFARMRGADWPGNHSS